MVATVILLGLLLVAAVTDVWRRKIYNWTIYPGILIALGLNGLAWVLGVDATSGIAPFWGVVGFADSLLGFLLCGAIVLVCYVFFSGGVGGGDVKLIAMMGAFLGVHRGLEALLWTFILGGCMALIALVWQVGLLKLLATWLKYILILVL